jgi:hypothetical protein
MRTFELTMRVFVPADGPLPETFRDWLTRATGVDCSEGPATATTLERIVETRYPLAADVIKRRKSKEGPWS